MQNQQIDCDQQKDEWRSWRVATGICTALSGVLAGMSVYYLGYLMYFVLHTFGNFFGIMSGSTPAMSKYPGDELLIFGLFGFLICGAFGLRFARDANIGRHFVFVMACLTIPVGIGLLPLWVLYNTRRGVTRVPPEGRAVRKVLLTVTAVAVIVVFWSYQAERELEYATEANRKADLYALINDGTTSEVRELLEQGADPSQLDKLGVSVLAYALELELDCCKGDYYDKIALLLEHGADPNTPSRLDDGAAYIELVTANQDDEGLSRWLDTDRLLRGYLVYSPLDQVVVMSDINENAKLLDLLLDYGADANRSFSRLPVWPLLLTALDIETPIQGPIAQGKYVFPESSPLENAINENQHKAVFAMTGRGVKPPVNILERVRELTNDGNRPQGDYRDHKILQALLKAGANVNAEQSNTSLALAVIRADVKLAEILMKFGADPDQIVVIEGEEYTPKAILQSVPAEVRRQHIEAWQALEALILAR